MDAQTSKRNIVTFIASLSFLFAVWFFEIYLGSGKFEKGVVHSRSQKSERKDRLEGAVEILVRVPTGRDLVESAKLKWKFEEPKEIIKFLQWGQVSKTDSVLTRHYDPETGREHRERQLTIYLRKEQVLTDIVLDLAHELSHATSTRDLDPYDPSLTPGRYIRMAIEGDGGEVEALTNECQVALELLTKFDVPISRCQRYISNDGYKIDRAKVKKDFYRVGKWKGKLSRMLGTEKNLFPMLSGQKPQLYSSTGNSPYPVALYEEYRMMTQVACENTEKRVRFLRAPASVGPMGRLDPASSKKIQTSKEFLQKRCHTQAHSETSAFTY